MEFILKNKKLIFFLFLAVAIFLVFFLPRNSNHNRAAILIGDKELEVEIADDAEEAYRGLSFRESLPENSGMLFIFSNQAKQRFVMRNMKFPIDIIFIKDGEVKGIEADCQPEGEDYKKVYESRVEVDMVLEVSAGYAKEKNITTGTSFKILKFL